MYHLVTQDVRKRLRDVVVLNEYIAVSPTVETRRRRSRDTPEYASTTNANYLHQWRTVILIETLQEYVQQSLMTTVPGDYDSTVLESSGR